MKRILSPVSVMLAKNTMVQLVGRTATILIGIFPIAVLTRYLGPSQYGLYSVSLALAGILSTIADFGINLSFIKDTATEADKSEQITAYIVLKSISIGLTTILGFIYIILAPSSDIEKGILAFGLLVMITGSFSSFFLSQLQAKLQLTTVTICDIAGKIVSAILTVFFAYTYASVEVFVLAIAFGNSVTLLGALISGNMQKSIKRPINFQLSWALGKQAAIVGVTSVLAVMYFKIDTFLLSHLDTAKAVGLYAVAYKLFENILVVWGFFMASAYPLLAKTVASNDINKLRSLLKHVLYILITSSLLIIVFGYIFAPTVILVLGGAAFAQAQSPFQILLWSVPLLFLNNTFFHLSLALDFGKKVSLIMVLAICINVIGNIFAITYFSYIGAAIMTILTELCISIGYLWLLRKKILFLIHFNS